jgi:hypothetical protein
MNVCLGRFLDGPRHGKRDGCTKNESGYRVSCRRRSARLLTTSRGHISERYVNGEIDVDEMVRQTVALHA